MISKAFVVAAYQSKLDEIAACDDIELTVVVPPSWRESGRELALERHGSASYRLVVAPIRFNGAFHLHYYPTLPRILRETRPEVCHIDEEPYNLATWLALREAQRAGAKTLFFSWQNLLRKYPWPFCAMERYVYKHVDAAIAGNREAAEVLRRKGYRGPVEVIPQFGVDPAIYRPRERSASRVYTIGYAGRLEKQKGLQTLVDALATLEGAWHLDLYGSGPLEEDLRTRLTALGLAERASFHQRVPSERMPIALADLDVLVLPSLTQPNWKEQFGRVLIEAMACGVPVIGSDSGEIPHVIGDTGMLFPEGDHFALQQCLATLRDDRELRLDLGQRGRARVLTHYTQHRIARSTVALYRSLYQDEPRRL